VFWNPGYMVESSEERHQQIILSTIRKRASRFLKNVSASMASGSTIGSR